MIIAGFQKMTLLDYPDKIATLIFTQGCNFACHYCHNPDMVAMLKHNKDSIFKEEDVLAFLETRKGMLDAVVVSGGEPTMHKDLPDFMKKIRKMGFLLKLDTNGSNPEMLKVLLKEGLVDYFAMDIKYPEHGYKKFCPLLKIENIDESAKIIMESGVDYEFRSTILPSFHSDEDIKEMAKMIEGADRWFLQNFRSNKTLDRKLEDASSFTQEKLNELRTLGLEYVKTVGIRN